jgi:hypothetical protein
MEDRVPSFIPVSTAGHPEPEEWGGPPIEVLLQRAQQQPGAKVRSRGVKFQCPACDRAGADRSRDNAMVWNDGRWGCCIDPSHRSAIGEVLGFAPSSTAVTDLGEDFDGWILKDILGDIR